METNGTEVKEAPTAEVAIAPKPLEPTLDVRADFGSRDGFALIMRQANALASSDMVPATYKGKPANCIVALEMAHRMNASPLMVMQNLYLVHGQPGWSSKFLIATFNNCGRFTAIRYKFNDDRTACRAWTTEKATGDVIEGSEVTIGMAKEEGWSTKAGSKWKTMPELMLQYRAAAFLIRTYAPEISMGLMTEEEVVDIAPVVVESARPVRRSPAQMKTLAMELVNGETDMDKIKAAYPDMPADQLEELQSIAA